jgi:hypothetical protein
MTIAKSEDIRWIARGLDDSAILLRVHGIEHLADQLDVVRVALSESDTSDADGHQRGTRL